MQTKKRYQNEKGGDILKVITISNQKGRRRKNNHSPNTSNRTSKERLQSASNR